MTNYTKTTDFAAKDSLPSGDSGKIIRGSEFETEFDNIATAVNSKSDANNPTFTGTVTIDGLTVNGNTILGNAATDTVTVTADIASNLIPSADDTYNLGAVGAEWNDLHVDGVAYIDTINGFAATGDVNFGDNDKAQFGAGNDLQIYHNGTHSYISESGTGDLKLYGANIEIGNTAGFKNIFAASGGGTFLYNNNALKLSTTTTGIDVTGTVTADGLTVDGTVDVNLGSDGSNIASLSGASAGRKLDIQSFAVGASAGAGYSINATSGQGELDFQTAGASRLNIDADGDISFYEDTGTTAKLTWSASTESLTVGSTQLNFNGAKVQTGDGSTASAGFNVFTSSTGDGYLLFSDGNVGNQAYTGQIRYNHASDFMTFGTNGGAERMRIDSAGNVGIGTQTVTNSTGYQRTSINGSNGGILEIKSSDTPVARFLATGGSAQLATLTAIPLLFNTNGLERMRIDSSGNVLVGKTSGNTLGTPGVEIDGNLNRIMVTRDDQVPMFLNRNSTNGIIQEFRKDNSTVGTIGSSASQPFFAGTSNGFRLSSGGVVPSNSSGANADNAYDLGGGPVRWKDLYLSGGAYLGGVAAANKLDDYEEGTFTLTNNSDATGTLTNGGGAYVKIGQQVFIEGAFQVGVNFTNNSVGGLPFAVATATGVGSSVRPIFMFDETGTGKFLRVVNGGSTLHLFDSSGAVDSPDTTGSLYRFMGSYRTTA